MSIRRVKNCNLCFIGSLIPPSLLVILMSKVHGVCVHKTIKCYCTISLIVDKSCFTSLCYSMVTNFGTRWRSIFYLLHLILHQRYVLHSPLPTATTATTCRVGHPLRKLWQVKASLLVNVEKSIWKSCFFCCVGWTWTRGSSTCRPPEPMWSLQALLGIEEWCAWRVVQRPYVLWLNDLILIDEYKVRGFSSSSSCSWRHAAAWTKI